MSFITSIPWEYKPMVIHKCPQGASNQPSLSNHINKHFVGQDAMAITKTTISFSKVQTESAWDSPTVIGAALNLVYVLTIFSSSLKM